MQICDIQARLAAPCTLLCLLVLACPETQDPCNSAGHCERGVDGDPRCLPGYDWRDPGDLDDYVCVLVGTTDAGPADIGSHDLTTNDLGGADGRSDLSPSDLGSSDHVLVDTAGQDRPIQDARTPDAGASDTHVNDANAIDTRVHDSRIDDARVNDTRVNDAHVDDAHVDDAHVDDAYVDDAACGTSGWTYERVPYPTAALRFLDMAYDTNNRPHLMFLRDTNGEGWETLWYATHNGSQWNSEEVDVNSNFYAFPSLVVDSTATVHIVFTHYESSVRRLVHLHGSAGNWTRDLVPSTGEVSPYCNVAIGSDDHLHVSYGADPASGADTLNYATFDGSQWTRELVSSSVSSLLDNAIAVDRDDHPHIIFRDGRELNYAWLATGWPTEALTGSYPTFGPRGFVMDRSYRAHVIYADSDSWNLKYALRDTGWNTTNMSSGQVADKAALAIDTAGEPYIAEYDNSAKQLLLHTLIESQWQSELVVCNDETGWPMAMGIAATGAVGIAYGDVERDELWFAHRAP